jgi:hypothetical protein
MNRHSGPKAKNPLALALMYEIDSLVIIACGNDNVHDDANPGIVIARLDSPKEYPAVAISCPHANPTLPQPGSLSL